MSKIKIDGAFLREFERLASLALADVANDLGVKVKWTGGNYERSGSNAVLKLEIMAPSAETGEFSSRKQEKARRNFDEYAGQYGLKSEDLGKTITVQGRDLTITGLSPRRPKFPVNAVDSSGKEYKVPAATVLSKLGRSMPTPVDARNLLVRTTGAGIPEEIKRRFSRLTGELSPENLTCDGELSRAQVDARRAEIMREWRGLEAQVGFKVDEGDVYRWEDLDRR